MPQIWLTDNELGHFLKCDADAARRVTIQDGWARRKCSDGFSRAKLPAATACDFMLHFVQSFDHERLTDAMVSDLRGVIAQATRSPAYLERLATAG